jgi:ribosome-interacting GTPase 1
MPTNVSLEFAKAQKKFHEATTDEEKLVALQEMKSTAPSHKGAETLRAEINSKLAKLKNAMERQKTQKAKKGSAPSLYVKKDGVGQIAIIGLPNTGKSWLLNKLVGKKLAEETDYGFSTYVPVPGMMPYEEGLIQLVELPALVDGSSSGKANGREIISLVRNADAVIVVGKKNEQKIVNNELAKAKIYLNKTRPKIKVRGSDFRGIQISGKEHLKFPEDQLIGYLKSTGYANSKEVTDHSLVDLRDQIFLLLDKILIYTKKPGKDVDKTDPMSLPIGSTLEDMAKHLHKDFAKKLKFAKVWGSTKFPGQRVGPDYVLKNKDIVEISI